MTAAVDKLHPSGKQLLTALIRIWAAKTVPREVWEDSEAGVLERLVAIGKQQVVQVLRL
jgi:hypothetical protein